MNDKQFVRGCIALTMSVVIIIIPYLFDDAKITDDLISTLKILREVAIGAAIWCFAKSKTLTTENEEQDG